jgi:hypothetical protein
VRDSGELSSMQSALLPVIITQTARIREKFIKHKMFLIISKTFVWNIPQYKKNLVSNQKFIFVFM